MYFMDRMPQSIAENPALVPNVKFYMSWPGMGGVGVHAYNSGFNYGEFDDFYDHVGEDGYNPDEFVNSIGNYDRFFTESCVNLFSFGFGLREKDYFSFGINLNNSTTVKAASDVAYLLADYDHLSLFDFPLRVNDVSVLSNSYVSIGFTYSRRIDEHLTLGISPHLNLNLLGVRTTAMSYIVDLDASAYPSREYDQTFQGEALIGLPTEINPDAIDGNELDLDEGVLPDGWADNLGGSDLFKNKSLSIDLGATYDLDKWTLSASILNLGASSWKTNAYLLRGEDETVYVEEKNKVSIGIPAKIYLGAKRQFAPKWNYGFVLNNSFYKEGANASATLSLNGAVGRMLSTSVSYTAGYLFDNFGLGMRLRFFPGMDVYVVTDNIVQAFNYKKSQRVSAAFGINYSFGVKDPTARAVNTDDSIK